MAVGRENSKVNLNETIVYIQTLYPIDLDSKLFESYESITNPKKAIPK